MRRKNELQKRTEDALAAFGIHPDPISIQSTRGGMTFRFASPLEAQKELENRSRFAQGPLGILHAGEVGGVLTEYRSYRNGTRFSLHVVLGRNGLVYAEIDRFNPYQGATGLVLHGVLELFPYLMKRLVRMR
jgi:hypothetical protein